MTALSLIIITGQTGAGKSTLARFFRSAGFPGGEFSEFFEHLLDLSSVGRNARYRAITEYISSVGRSVYIRTLLHWINRIHEERTGMPVVLVGARHPDDIALIGEQCRVVEVVGLVAPTCERRRRVEARSRPIDSCYSTTSLNDPLVTACIRRYATVVIKNDGSLDQFSVAATKLIQKFRQVTMQETWV